MMEPARENEEASKVQDTISVNTDANTVLDYVQKQIDSVSYEVVKVIGCKRDENDDVQYNVQWLAHTWIPAHILTPFQFLIDKYCEENVEQTEPIVDNKTTEMTEQVIEEGSSQQINCEVEMMSSSNDVHEQNKEGDKNIVVGKITTETLKTNQNEEAPVDFTCPICQQSFFMKSDLEVHILFCSTKDQVEDKNTVESTVGEVIETETTCLADPTTALFEINSIKDALKLSQTFEYIPLTMALECDSCNKRLPVSNSVVDVDMNSLLWNATKKTIGENVEVFECQECHRDYLYKHPGAGENRDEKDKEVESTECSGSGGVRKWELEKPFKCTICSRSFEFASEMYEHEVRHTNTSSRYSCAKCNEKFSTRNALQEHYKATDNNCSPRKCDICFREFVHANHLRRHMSIHAGIKPFTCSICSHEFNQKSDLQRHQKRHTVEGGLACVKCSMSFKTIEELRDHILVHQHSKEEKNVYKCDKCEKTFGRKSHYKRHLSIHEGIKPYSCEICRKAFNQRTDLKRHHLSHERKKWRDEIKETGQPSTGFCCEICQKVFPQAEILAAHKTVHQQIENTGLPY